MDKSETALANDIREALMDVKSVEADLYGDININAAYVMVYLNMLLAATQIMGIDELLDRIGQQIHNATCPGREGPYGGYDIGFGLKAPADAGRFTILDFRDPRSETWGRAVHRTNSQNVHDAQLNKLTLRHQAAAAINVLIDVARTTLAELGMPKPAVPEIDHQKMGLDSKDGPTWTCFHCNQAFTDHDAAKAHFGSDERDLTACQIKAGAEQSLLIALRQVEQENQRLYEDLHNESADAIHAHRAAVARHGAQLINAEELGYARGLADGRAQAFKAWGNERVEINAIAKDARASLEIRSPRTNAIFSTLHGHHLSSMTDEEGFGYPLVDLLSNPAPADIGTGEMQMVEIADAIEETLQAHAFQLRAGVWGAACFTPDIIADLIERTDRFLEEALELAQSVEGYSSDRAHALVRYVFSRPAGDAQQEVGGVRVTLAMLCNAARIDEDAAAERELARIWTKIDQIRDKQAAKPIGSALPIAHADPQDEHHRIKAERDFLLARENAKRGWWTGEERWTGASSDALVSIAFGGTGTALPADASDLASCYRTVMRLPDHLITPAVLKKLREGEEQMAEPNMIAHARYSAKFDWTKFRTENA